MLQTLNFSDLFIGPSFAWSWFKATPGSRTSVPLPAECEPEVDRLREHMESFGAAKDFRIRWPNESSGVRLRVKRRVVDDGKTIYICRRFNLRNLTLSATGLQPAVINTLMADHPALKSGVIAFLGAPGVGKSSTAAALMLDLLRKYAGTAWTVENPIELPLQGPHGNGWCYQVEVDEDEAIGDVIRELYRAVPNILFIGEVRDKRTAQEVVRAAGSGYLVLFTFHANDLTSGLGQFARLAAATGNDATSATFADVLRCAIHLDLHKTPIDSKVSNTALIGADPAGTGSPPQVLSAKPLFFLEDDTAAGPRSHLRSGDYHMLKNEIDRQRRTLMAGASLL